VNGRKVAHLTIMALGWGATGAFVAYSFGIRRLDLLVACGVVVVAVVLAISGVLFLLAGDRSPPPPP